jgi:hypothetical protein
MSAYICDKKHIAYLVAAACSHQLQYAGGACARWFNNGQWHECQDGDAERMAEVANMLWMENIRSVSHRYPGESSATLPGPCSVDLFQPGDVESIWDHINPVQVIKACHCYSYQTCEHDEWEASEAHAFIHYLLSLACHRLPGYEEAEWGAPERRRQIA